MKRSTAAISLSALVFPGAGHIYLKMYWQGCVLLIASLSAVSYLMIKAIEKAQAISNKIIAGDIPLDMSVISEHVQRQVYGVDGQWVTVSTWVFFSCWLVGIIDTYRLKHKLDTD